MPRISRFLRTERTISWFARRTAFSTRRAGGVRAASSPCGLRKPAGMVGSLRGSLPEMCRSIDSTASRDATSPAACPPMPSATTKRRCCGTRTNESSFELRFLPTSDSPALSNSRSEARLLDTRFPLHPALVALRGRKLLKLGEGRLVVGLAREHRPQLVDRLLVAARRGQGKGEVEAGRRVVGVHLERALEGGDRLVPALHLAAGHPQVVV